MDTMNLWRGEKMRISDVFAKLKIVFIGVNIAAPVLSFILGIVLAFMGRLNFINGVFVIIIFPLLIVAILGMDPILLNNWGENGDEWEKFKHHKISTVLYWISSIILVVAVIIAFAKGINPELSQWMRFWTMVWEYIKGFIPFWISAGVRSFIKEDADASKASDLRAMARRFRK